MDYRNKNVFNLNLIHVFVYFKYLVDEQLVLCLKRKDLCVTGRSHLNLNYAVHILNGCT